MAKPVVAYPQKLAVSIEHDIVHLEFLCGDRYAAQVLWDDIMDRLRAGEGLKIAVEQPAPATPEKMP